MTAARIHSWVLFVLLFGPLHFFFTRWKRVNLDRGSERRYRSTRTGRVSDPLEQDQEVAGEFWVRCQSDEFKAAPGRMDLMSSCFTVMSLTCWVCSLNSINKSSDLRAGELKQTWWTLVPSLTLTLFRTGSCSVVTSSRCVSMFSVCWDLSWSEYWLPIVDLCRGSSESLIWINPDVWARTSCAWRWKMAVSLINVDVAAFVIDQWSVVITWPVMCAVLRVQTQQQVVSDAGRSIRRQWDHRLRQLHLLSGQTGGHVQYVTLTRPKLTGALLVKEPRSFHEQCLKCFSSGFCQRPSRSWTETGQEVQRWTSSRYQTRNQLHVNQLNQTLVCREQKHLPFSSDASEPEAQISFWHEQVLMSSGSDVIRFTKQPLIFQGRRQRKMATLWRRSLI